MVAQPAAAAGKYLMTRLIKRYGNRKLYDTKASRYVTLDSIAEMVRAEEDLRVIDNDSGEDLTALTFAQIIYEEAKRNNVPQPAPVLRWIIQQGGQTLQDIVSQVGRGREALESVRELAEERMHDVRELAEERMHDVRELVLSELPAKVPAADLNPLRLFNELLEMPQRQLEQMQQRVDTQVRTSIERLTHNPTFRAELQRVEDSLRALERQLGQLRRLVPPGRDVTPTVAATSPAAATAAPKAKSAKTKGVKARPPRRGQA